MQGADALDAVVDGSDARAQPDVKRGGGGECGVEDDEAWSDGEVLEGVLVLRRVIGGPSDGSVFAGGKGGGDAEYGDRSGENGIAEGRGVEIEGFEVRECGCVVRHGLDFLQRDELVCEDCFFWVFA